MAYIGNKPANKAIVASDLDPAVITGQTALTDSPASTDEFLISDAGTLKRLDASLIGGTNTPAFHCTMSGSQTIANATTTILQYDTEVYDTDSAFNTSNYTFTAPSAGKYFFKIATAGIFCDSTTETCIIGVYVNGTQYQKTTHNRGTVGTDTSFFHESIVPLSASDAVTAKIYHTQGSSRGNDAAVAHTFFQGFKLIGV